MRKLKVYLDTSVISYLSQEDAPERMKDTLELWKDFVNGKYDVYLSQVTLDEIEKCSESKRNKLYDYLSDIEYTKLEINAEIVELAQKIIDMGILRPKSFDDCQHIAAAVVNACDCIISWNFKHIVNVKTIRGIKAITTYEGYKDLMIYPPSALLEEEDEDYGSDDKRT